MVILGRIAGPYGVRGWARVQSFGDDPVEWGKMQKWWLGPEADWLEFEVEACLPYRSGLVVHFVGVDDRGTASRLCGLYVAAPRHALPPTKPGEYYWDELIGLDVANATGERLGKVNRLISAGAHPILCVQDRSREYLIPFVEQIIKEVSIDGGLIRADWDKTW